MGRWFPVSGDGAPLGMPLTLAVCNTPETILDGWVYEKLCSVLEQEYPKPSFEIEETHKNVNTPIRIKIDKKTDDKSSEGQRIAPGLRETRQRSDNCSRHCLLSNWEPRTFSAGATTKPPLGPLRAGIEDFTQKIEPVSVPHLFEQVGCFRVFLVRSLYDSLAAP